YGDWSVANRGFRALESAMCTRLVPRLKSIKELPVKRSLLACFALVIPLVSFALAPNRAAEEAGFAPLFDGKTLDGWQGGKDGYLVQDGAIASQPKGSGNLATIKEYGDFHLKFEFKLTEGA